MTIAITPRPPYYAVIFTNRLSDDTEGYDTMADKMVDLAAKQRGFLGVESVREGLGITVSYWKDEESILNWKQVSDHQLAQKMGRDQWYKTYKTRVAKVERDYDFSRPD